jgi:hypothetical protein
MHIVFLLPIVRYLLEDGKLNLSLRNLVEYKAYQWKNLVPKNNGSRNADITVRKILFGQ